MQAVSEETKAKTIELFNRHYQQYIESGDLEEYRLISPREFIECGWDGWLLTQYQLLMHNAYHADCITNEIKICEDGGVVFTYTTKELDKDTLPKKKYRNK